MSMRSVNKRLACTPFPTVDLKTEVKGGLAILKQKEELTRLTVVYAGDGYEPGDRVWVRGDCCKHQYAKEVYTLEEGKPFVLVPVDMVQLHARPEPRYEPTTTAHPESAEYLIEKYANHEEAFAKREAFWEQWEQWEKLNQEARKPTRWQRFKAWLWRVFTTRGDA